ncbi:protein of unknown function [endosymbiont DhMRE of Dentiscutata heterogama]|uniref:hypothetical protein n=1 Tax=endosymbiont DhMRE of Dentiscutata heterogama TaxID=1609546 RepID=UPI000629D2D4|nr:hypothetical protein [endosymbiont DhMRE of Dentiscutata heterogama]CFW93058.1 protein of unknown function [endosymbiont DhMRE of Dentiscutata heterogama]
MTKEIIILSLIILVIYLYYQQNHPSIDKRSYGDLIKDLKRQVSHYQGLYQKRVVEDIDKLNNKSESGTQTDLSDQQINLLVQQWEEVAQWATSEGIDINKKWNLGMLKGKLAQQQQQFEQEKEKWKEEKKSLEEKSKQLKNKFLSFENWQLERNEWWQKMGDLKSQNEKQLRQLQKINLLFNPQVDEEEKVDFNGLYESLKQVAERERERERAKVDECPEVETKSNEVQPIFSRKKKQKKHEKK